MSSKDNYRILQLRNETSFILDDLVAMVVNSTLANQLRAFSDEVMALTPGFTFNLTQAKNLKNLTGETIKRYQSGAIGDVDLLSYQTDAHAILKGASVQIGGDQMAIKKFLGKVLPSKAVKQREALDKLEQNYQVVCAQITACQEKMNHCIKESQGHSPDSAVYRNNERVYNTEKNRLILLKKQEADLRKTLSDADRIRLVKEFADLQEEMEREVNAIFGSEKELAGLQAKAEIQSENLKQVVGRADAFGEGIFSAAEEELFSASTDSEFGAKVAAEERIQTQMELSGIAVESVEDAETDSNEFGALVSGNQKQ